MGAGTPRARRDSCLGRSGVCRAAAWSIAAVLVVGSTVLRGPTLPADDAADRSPVAPRSNGAAAAQAVRDVTPAPAAEALDLGALSLRLVEAFAAEAERVRSADPARHVSRWDTFFARVRVEQFVAEGLGGSPPRLTLVLHQDAVAGPGTDVAALESVVRAAIAEVAPVLAPTLLLQFVVALPGDAAPVPLARFERIDPASPQPSWPMLERPRRRVARGAAAAGIGAEAVATPSIQPASPTTPEAVRATAPLAGELLVIGASHGLYLEESSRQWLWQRPLLFTTVEDLLTWSVVHPFLVPMLEDAGATVVTTRQRDPVAWAGFDLHALDDPRVVRHPPTDIVAGSGPPAWREQVVQRGPGRITPRDGWISTRVPGAELVATLDLATWGPERRGGGGPFTMTWFHPPAREEQAAARVVVTVERDGVVVWSRVVAPNVTRGFAQTIGRVWLEPGARHLVRLRRDPADTSEAPFLFRRLLVGPAEDTERIGRLLETRRATPRPRELAAPPPPWHQAALYGLGAMGLGLVADDDRNEYQRDIIVRGELPNAFLDTAPVKPRLYLSFHTDAGVSADGLIGTLGLWRYVADDRSTELTSGASRLASWRLTRAVTDAIVEDVRALHAPGWTRRAVQDRDFGEVRRPRVASAIIELFAHQNFNDMRFGLDPQFRYDVARAIVRGIGRHIYPEPGDFVVAPRPVRRWSATPSGLAGAADAELTLRFEADVPMGDDPAWSATSGVWLEASRDGRHFRPVDQVLCDEAGAGGVTTWRVAPGRWEEGLRATAAAGAWVHLRLRAWNDGGIALASPVLSVRWGSGAELAEEAAAGAEKGASGARSDGAADPDAGGGAVGAILEVTGFVRLATPEWLDEPGRRGFVVDDARRRGRLDPAFVGPQVDFDPAERFRTNEQPGWGASLPSPALAELRREAVTADWSSWWTNRVDHPEPEGGIPGGGGAAVAVAAITAEAFATWSGAEEEEDLAAGAGKGILLVRYLARDHATSPPPPHATGAARARWIAHRPPWLPAGAGDRLMRAALDRAARLEVHPPGAGDAWAADGAAAVDRLRGANEPAAT